MTTPVVVGRIVAVCVVHADVPLDPRKPAVKSAIDKRPTTGPVDVGTQGPVTDHVCDEKHHGGLDQAIYGYSQHEADRWADELGRELPPGWFGENLRIDGPTTDLVVGTSLRIGDGPDSTLEVEVTIPRTPCRSFALWSGEDNWIKRFTERGDTGTYFRVLTPGPVRAGDPLTVTHVPEHGATSRDVFCATRPDRLAAILTGVGVPPKVERDVARALNRARPAP